MAERGPVKAPKQHDIGTYAIAREIGCVPSAIANKLHRGTLSRKGSKGKAPGFSPEADPGVFRLRGGAQGAESLKNRRLPNKQGAA